MLCPYCQQHFTVDNNCEFMEIIFYNKDAKNKKKRLTAGHIVCPNEKCKKPIIDIRLDYLDLDQNGEISNEEYICSKNIIPGCKIKIFPDYIPIQLRNDYEESCKIVELSPKASATLSRRCLQGIIRDFFGITKRTLAEEINAIEDKIDIELWEAIDAVRSMGNIGAHMEKDVNTIVDIDPGEAKQLIQLIEMLFEEWYIRRYERQKRLKTIVDINNEKQEERKGISKE